MSAGSGPRASMPSRRRISTAGATISISSLPSAPSSPACGLRPATASRGRAMPKRALRSAPRCARSLTISSVVSSRERLAQRQMDRHRHDGKRRRPQHHHRLRRRAAVGRKLGEKFGVAGMAEAGAVEHALGDRVGDDGAGAAGRDVVDRAADRGDGGGGAGGVRLAGLRRRGRPVATTGSAWAKVRDASSGLASASSMLRPSVLARSAKKSRSPSR